MKEGNREETVETSTSFYTNYNKCFVFFEPQEESICLFAQLHPLRNNFSRQVILCRISIWLAALEQVLLPHFDIIKSNRMSLDPDLPCTLAVTAFSRGVYNACCARLLSAVLHSHDLDFINSSLSPTVFYPKPWKINDS